MGSGKTTIGTLLARQLAWRFVDLDDRIEQSAGLAIPQIFERLGEQAFRQIEADQLRAALGRATEMKESTVLALGGGTYAQPGCPEFLRAAAKFTHGLFGTVGQGLAKVELSSYSGTIRILKRD